MLKLTFVIFVIAFVNYVQCEFNLTVVHISDFHSHWFEFDENKHDCSRQESREGKCFGGFPRLLSFVRDIRKREKNVLVVSSGEFFLGRSLHALHGAKLAQVMLQRLELDAMSLSNHDFDSGMLELSAYLYGLKFPVLCANMQVRNTSFLYSRVNKSVVIDVGGEKVGIVGYIHRHALKKTKQAASVTFLPEIPALQKEVQRLESEGVDKIIALGHAGYYTDLEIAKKVKGVDLVIGGDSDIMLYDPGPDANESSKIGNIHRNYPRIHHQEPEAENDVSLVNRTLVLHIPQHGMFVGVLRATFDDKGKIIHESGEPVLLDSSIPQDENTLDFLEFAKGALETLSEHSRLPEDYELLGKTEKHLDGNPRNCRMRECSFGNFIVDAMLHEFTFHYKNKTGRRYDFEHWGPIDAVVFNSGPIKRSIEPGYITIKDILKSVSLGGFIRRVYMSGKQLMDMMEHSVKHYDPAGVTAPGAFLQVAGLRVEYDLSQPPGSRVRSLAIRCRDCKDINTFFSAKPYKTYIIGMPTFLRNGRDGFYDFEETDQEDWGQFDALLIVEYLRRMFDIEPVLDGRIKFFQPENIDLNLTLGVPPLLFGEPLPMDNSAPYLHDDPIDEHVTKTFPEEVSSDKNIAGESVNNPPNLYTDPINKHASETSLENITKNMSIDNESVKDPSNLMNDLINTTALSPEGGTKNKSTVLQSTSTLPINEHVSKPSLENTTRNRNIYNESVKNLSNLINNRMNNTAVPPEGTTRNGKTVEESTSNLSKLPINEHVLKTYPESTTSYRKIDNESENKRENFNHENEHAFEVHVNEMKNSTDLLDKLQKPSKLSADDSTEQRVPNNVELTEHENKSAFQHGNDMLTQKTTQKSHSAVLPTKEVNAEDLSAPGLANNAKTAHVPKIEEFLKILLNSSAENNISSTMEKLSDIIPGLPKNIQQSVGLTDLKERLIKKRSVVESMAAEANKINYTELEDYMNFLDAFLRDIFKDAIPAASSSKVEPADIKNQKNVKSNEDKKAGDKNYIEEAVPQIDFRGTVIKSVKSILGEDILKKMLSALTNYGGKANASVTDENQL